LFIACLLPSRVGTTEATPWKITSKRKPAGLRGIPKGSLEQHQSPWAAPQPDYQPTTQNAMHLYPIMK
jgi:hypothetical protein